MNSITQEMQFRQSLMKYSEKYGVKRIIFNYILRHIICFPISCYNI